MEEKPKHLKAMLSEAKDSSELMVDLAYASLFFSDAGMADEVHELEDRLSDLVHQMPVTGQVELIPAARGAR